MTMTGLAVALAVLAVGTLVFAAVRAWLEMRGPRLVTCPETHEPAGVELDLFHAAISAAGGRPELWLRDCTRWPEKQGCGQTCLSEIENAEGGCLVREILRQWYAHKACVLCGRSVEEIHWHDHKPAVKAPDDRIWDWGEVPVTMLPGMLAVARPVCWNCSIAEGFRRDHPDLVIDRPRPPRLVHHS